MSGTPATQPKPPAPSLPPTRPSTLIGAFAVTVVVAWVLIQRFYGDIPRLPALPIVTFLLLALAEGVTARATKNRIERRPGTVRVEPLVVARLAALAKASSLGGAIFGGLYTGVFLYVLQERSRLAAAAGDLPVAGGGVLACAALVAAALWLERACRIPEDPERNREAA
jgi:predicted outer membrane lipoprotein